MARPTHHACRETARFGLLVLLAGCASMGNPPGGPQDFAPPVLLSTRPDSGAVLPEFDGDAEFQFDEVISEQSGGGLDNLVLLSPRPEKINVSWKRSRLTVRPGDGWRPGTVYHLTLLPGTTDLSNNRLQDRVTLIFTTGGPIPATTYTGTVIDWAMGRAAAGNLVEAVLMPDSLVYVTQTDSAGDFTFTALPRGQYQVFATVDGNSNGLRDRREPYDSTAVTVDSTATSVFWAFAHDSVGPQLRQTTLVDSVTVRVTFSQNLQPGPADSAAVTVRLLPDSLPIAHAAVWTPAAYDSIQAAEIEAARVADSVAAQALADSLAAADTAAAVAPVDSAAVDTTGARQDADRAPIERPQVAEQDTTQTVADTTRIERLLLERPALIDEWVIRLAVPVVPGARYVIDAVVANVNGAVAESRTLLIVPEAPEEPPPP